MEIRNVQDIVKATLEEGGVTADPIFFDQPTTGYAVGGVATTSVIPAAEFGPLDVLGYIATVPELWDSGVYLGTWLDGDTNLVHLDVVEVLDTASEALPTAAARGEIAIYDLAADVTIPV